MLKMNRVIICFVICFVQQCLGQFDGPHEPNYAFPESIERIGSRVSATQDFEIADSDPDSTFLEFENEIRDFDTALIDGLKKSEDTKCQRDIQYVITNLQGGSMWGIKMLDAVGKPGSGILDGNVKWVGNFHECTNIFAPLNENSTAGNFKGQYCSLDLTLGLFNRSLPLSVGLCIPDSCETELKQYIELRKVVNPMQALANFTKVTCQPTSKKISSAAIGVIFLLSVFVLLALIGSGMTAYEYVFETNLSKDSNLSNGELGAPAAGVTASQEMNSSTLGLEPERNLTSGLYGQVKPFFSCFCIFTNGEKLLNTDGTEGQLLCLHGIRFLSMTWVIVCHTYSFSFSSVGNLMETMDIIDTFLFQIILNGFFSVDSFFLLSGFLVAYLFFQEYSKRNGKFPWIYFYVHRYLRLTPVYMIVLGIYTTLFYYLGSGPFFTTNAVDQGCTKNWWYNVLYINNFLTVQTQCFGWAWYLANDMQFFIISPLFFITLWRWPKIGYSIVGIFLAASFAANFGITYYYDLICGLGNISTVGVDPLTFTTKLYEFFDKIYVKPYTRISPYILGILLGYYMFKRKQNKEGKINLITLVSGWVVASVITLTCLFSPYHNTMTTFENSLYNSMNRTCFACGLAWVIFTCLIGQGGPVNSILSFKPFIPLSRLTYCAYLVHPIFIHGYFDTLKEALHFSHMTIVTTYLGLLIMTYFTSFLVSILFESPIIRLEKLIRTKFSK